MPPRRSAPVVNLEETVAYQLVVLANLISTPFLLEMGPAENATLQEWRVIQTLALHPGATASQICEHTGMHKMNVSRAVSRLVRARRIVFSSDPNDARRKILKLTRAGMALYRRIYPTAVRRAGQLTRHLSAQEERTLQAVIGRLIAALREDGAP